jgi:hypothetical protein
VLKIIFLPLLLGAGLYAQTQPPPHTAAIETPPKLPDATLARYWRAIAGYHAQNAALQASLTSKQKQMQESIADTDKQIDEIRKQLAAACGDKAMLDESGSDPVCVAKEAPKASTEPKK